MASFELALVLFAVMKMEITQQLRNFKESDNSQVLKKMFKTLKCRRARYTTRDFAYLLPSVGKLAAQLYRFAKQFKT